MISLTYLSRATAPQSATQLRGLLSESREWNAHAGITGLLLYAEEKFIQTLEGDRETVEVLLARIVADPRHSDVDVTLVEDVPQRHFPNWAMGFRVLRPQDCASLAGFSDFLEPDGRMYEYAQHLGRAGVFHRIFRDLHPGETDL